MFPPRHLIDLSGRLGSELESLPATRESAGDPRPHHRPEPFGALRPSGVARVPGACLGRPSGGCVCPKDGDDPPYHVLDGVEAYKYRSYAPGGGKLSYITEYAYSLPRDGPADAQGTAVWPVRCAAGLQPAGHLLADRPGSSRRSTAHDSYSTTTICALSSSSRVFLMARGFPTGRCWPWSAGRTGPRTM